ncbi:MAG TPA: DNA (cytosine-5-)-methyltransferase [Nitrospira sp.]|nr:DNA (cytosine-5-)-methyltransferase [Nitrospira sp.]
MQKLRVLDLFSGIGGFSLGLERTGGFETVAFCEIEPFPRKVLAKHWPNVPCYEDVRTLTGERLAADGIAVDVICGGFPCQDLSTAGSGTGLDGDRSGLWFEFARLIREIRPQFVILENSPELLNGWMGDILRPLAQCGYDAEWDCIPARAVGAPHLRYRLWLIAYPSGDGLQRQRKYPKSINPTPDAFREANPLVDAFQRKAMPFVCRGHDGVSKQVDEARNYALGNAVLPQIPELIGHAILESIRSESEAA